MALSEENKANARKFVADDGTVTYDMRTGFLLCAGYGRSIEGYSDFDLYGYNGATCEDIKGVCGDADPACGAGGATNADTGMLRVGGGVLLSVRELVRLVLLICVSLRAVLLSRWRVRREEGN